MIKIIHCADIHIGAVMQNLPEDKARTRRQDIIDTFVRLIEYAGQHRVRAVIIAGDLFDRNSVARSVKKEILDAIESCPKTDFLYLTGNHDYKVRLDDEERAIPPNLKLFDKKDDWTYFDFETVCIAGFDIHNANSSDFYEKLKFKDDRFNIAVLHGKLGEIQLKRLQGKGINYLALGDVHIPDTELKRLDNRGGYAYCGCLEGRGNDEIGERGFFALEITPQGKMQRSFVNIAKREYKKVEIDITGLDTHSKIYDAMFNKTKSIERKNIVRVELKGKYNADTQKEREELERKLRENFFWGDVKDSSKLDRASVDYQNEISLKSEFVRLVTESSGLSEAEKDKIIEYGIKALHGEEIKI